MALRGVFTNYDGVDKLWDGRFEGCGLVRLTAAHAKRNHEGTIMKLEIVEYKDAAQADFVAFWSSEYRYNLETLYETNIGQPLTEERVWGLYRWKNGTEKISEQKQQSIRTIYIPQLGKVPSLNSDAEGKQYIGMLSGGAIWDIFWLHCNAPARFPIFDQHTYRSMAKINSLDIPEIPSNRSKKIDAYFDLYLPFTRRFKEVDPRQLDRAFFAYGKFLKKGLAGK